MSRAPLGSNDARLKPWDFRASTRFTPEHVRALERVLDHLQPMLQTHLSARLRGNLELHDVQAGVLRLGFETLTRALQDAFQVAVPDLVLEMGDLDVTGQVMGFVLAAETVLRIRATMSVSKTLHGAIELLVPFAAVETFLLILTQGYRRNETETERVVRLGRHLAHRRVRVQVRLGSARETVRALLALEPGDTIRLPVRVGEPVWAYAQGHPVFMGRRIGQADGHVALQVTQEVEGGDGE
jgi:flagellar motor switch protein FliM